MKTLLVVCVCLGPAILPVAAAAVDLTLPAGAQQMSDRISALDSYDLPLGPFADGAVPVRGVEGRIERRTWQIEGGSMTTLQLLDPLREQVRAAGFKVVFECRDRTCGGFDFRFGTEIAPAPDMHVDISNYRFVAATRGDADVISVLVSNSRSAAFVQIIEVVALDTSRPQPTATTAITPAEPEPAAVGPKPATTEPSAPKPAAPVSLIERLQGQGHVVLDDLEFGTGAGKLGKGPYASLKEIAEFLNEHPDVRVVLVGHTDSVGGLSGNIALSKRRAAAVRNRMISAYDAPSRRTAAEGNGYLSPIASNGTPEGRRANRRVEAILLPR